MIFRLMLATVLITHVKKQRNRKCQKLDKCLQITSPFSKITDSAPFPPRRLSNTCIAIQIFIFLFLFSILLTFVRDLYSKPQWKSQVYKDCEVSEKVEWVDSLVRSAAFINF